MNNNKVTYLSQSKLQAYMRCPKSVFAPFEESEASIFGNKVHKALAHYSKTLDLPADIEPDVLNEIAGIITEPDVELNPDTLICVESEDQDTVLHDKHMFQIEIEKGVWGLRGIFDRVDLLEDGTLRIIDWKTGGYQDDDFQLKYYALAALFLYKNPNIEAGFYYTKQNKYYGKRYKREDLLEFAKELSEVAKAYLNDKEFKPKLNKFCNWCGLRNECEEYKKALNFDVQTINYNPPAEVKQLFEEIEKLKPISIVIDNRLKELQEKQKEILRENNNELVVSDWRYILKEYPGAYEHELCPVLDILKMAKCRYSITDIADVKIKPDKIKKLLQKQGYPKEEIKHILSEIDMYKKPARMSSKVIKKKNVIDVVPEEIEGKAEIKQIENTSTEQIEIGQTKENSSEQISETTSEKENTSIGKNEQKNTGDEEENITEYPLFFIKTDSEAIPYFQSKYGKAYLYSFQGINFFVHKDIQNPKIWVATEIKTGRFLAKANKKKDCKQLAEDKITVVRIQKTKELKNQKIRLDDICDMLRIPKEWSAKDRLKEVRRILGFDNWIVLTEEEKQQYYETALELSKNLTNGEEDV